MWLVQATSYFVRWYNGRKLLIEGHCHIVSKEKSSLGIGILTGETFSHRNYSPKEIQKIAYCPTGTN